MVRERQAADLNVVDGGSRETNVTAAWAQNEFSRGCGCGEVGTELESVAKDSHWQGRLGIGQ